jgi:general secretion pathway protein L
MLGALSAASPPGRVVSGVEYSPGESRVKGLAYTPNEVRAVVAALKSQGFAATMQGDALVITPENLP